MSRKARQDTVLCHQKIAQDHFSSQSAPPNISKHPHHVDGREGEEQSIVAVHTQLWPVKSSQPFPNRALALFFACPQNARFFRPTQGFSEYRPISHRTTWTPHTTGERPTNTSCREPLHTCSTPRHRVHQQLTALCTGRVSLPKPNCFYASAKHVLVQAVENRSIIIVTVHTNLPTHAL